MQDEKKLADKSSLPFYLLSAVSGVKMWIVMKARPLLISLSIPFLLLPLMLRGIRARARRKILFSCRKREAAVLAGREGRLHEDRRNVSRESGGGGAGHVRSAGRAFRISTRRPSSAGRHSGVGGRPLHDEKCDRRGHRRRYSRHHIRFRRFRQQTPDVYRNQQLYSRPAGRARVD